jgi:uncharacterized membrane protein (DUF373 family)
MEHAESVMFLAIAAALLVIAVVVFVRSVQDLVLAPSREQFAVTITKAVNNVLFIVVVLELLRTIVARLKGGGFQLQPFLVIGIISATRDILTVTWPPTTARGQGFVSGRCHGGAACSARPGSLAGDRGCHPGPFGIKNSTPAAGYAREFTRRRYAQC